MTRYRKSWTETIKEVILNEALKPLDKSVVDAFYYKKEKAGKVVSTDGDSLWKNGLGGQEIAIWMGRKIHISAVSDVKSTEAILKYMKKSIPAGVFEEVEMDEKFAGWIAFHPTTHEKMEIRPKKGVIDSLYDAKQAAIKHWKLPKSKHSLLAIEPAHEEVEATRMPMEAPFVLEEGVTGPTRMEIQKFFDKEKGTLRARLNATEKHFNIMKLIVNKKETVVGYRMEEVEIDEKWEAGVVYHQDFGGGEISYFRADSLLKNKRWKGMAVDEYSGKQKKPRNITADEKTSGWKITPKDKIPKGLKEEVDIDEVQMGKEGMISNRGRGTTGTLPRGTTLSQLHKEYRRNENKNEHTENYKLLAAAFGTKEEVAKIAKIQRKSEEQGHTSKSDMDWMYKNINPYYDKIRNEEVEIGEKKSHTGYELYHKDFSSAMQHAYAHAKSKGFVVDPKEIDDKVATGPKKPSSGKTNRYALKAGRKTVHIQVANLDNKRYELNTYIEDYDKNQLLRVKHDEALIAEAGDICSLNRGVLRSKSMQAVWEKKCAPKLHNQTLGEKDMEKLVDTVRRVLVGEDSDKEEPGTQGDKAEYQKKRKEVAKKFGVESCSALKDEAKRKECYNALDKAHVADHEEQVELKKMRKEESKKKVVDEASKIPEPKVEKGRGGWQVMVWSPKGKYIPMGQPHKDKKSAEKEADSIDAYGNTKEENVTESQALQLKMALDDVGVKIKGTKGGKIIVSKKDKKATEAALKKSFKKGGAPEIKYEDVEKTVSKLFSHVRKLMSK